MTLYGAPIPGSPEWLAGMAAAAGGKPPEQQPAAPPKAIPSPAKGVMPGQVPIPGSPEWLAGLVAGAGGKAPGEKPVTPPKEIPSKEIPLPAKGAMPGQVPIPGSAEWLKGLGETEGARNNQGQPAPGQRERELLFKLQSGEKLNIQDVVEGIPGVKTIVPETNKAIPVSDKIPEPNIDWSHVKPDQERGNIATIDGEQRFMPGSTGYEMGFRTFDEYSLAHSLGLTYGPHGGEDVPDNIVLLHYKTSGWDNWVPSGEEGKFKPQPTDTWIAAPLPGTSDSEGGSGLLYGGSSSSEEYKEWFNRHAADLSFDEWNQWNIKAAELFKKHDGNIEATQREFYEKYGDIYKKWYRGKLELSAGLMIPVEGKLLNLNQYNILKTLQGERQYEYSQKLGLTPTGTVYKNLGGGEWGYERVEDIRKREAEQKAKEIFENKIKQPDFPAELRDAYNEGDIDAYNDAVKKYLKKTEEAKEIFENKIKQPDFPAELRDAYNEGDIDAYNDAVQIYNDRIEAESKANVEALQELTPYKIEGEDGYDIARYLRNNPGKESTLVTVGFKETDIEEAKTYNNLAWVKKNPFEEYNQLMHQELAKRGLDKAESIPYMFASGYIIDPDSKEKIYISNIEESNNEITRLISEKYIRETHSAPLSLESFTQEYLVSRNIPDNHSQKSLEAKWEASAEYARYYGDGAFAKDLGIQTAKFLFIPARALYPEVTIKDISGMEWGLGAAQISLLALPGVGSLVGKAAGTGISRLATTGIGLAAGGLFTAETIKSWDSMSLAERSIAVAMDVLILGGAVYGMKGFKTKGETATGNKAADKISQIVSEGQTPLTLAERAHGIGSTIGEISARISSETGGVFTGEGLERAIASTLKRAKYEAGDAGIMAKEIADNIRGKMSRISAKFSAETGGVFTGEGLERAIASTLKRAKYEAGDAGIMAKEIADNIRGKMSRISAKFSAETGGVFTGEGLERAIASTLKRAKYQVGDVNIAAKRIAEDIRENVSRIIAKISAQTGGVYTGEQLEKAIASTLKRAKYEAGDAGIMAKEIADNIRGKMSRISAKFSAETGGVFTGEGLERAIASTLKRAKYQVGDVNIAAKRIAEDIRENVSRIIAKISAQTGGVYTGEQLEKAIASTLKRAKYGSKATTEEIKYIIDEYIKGYREKQGIYRVKPSEIRSTLSDIEKAIASKNPEELRKAGQRLTDIGENLTKEQGGEVLAQRGKQIIDKADEIVKMAEKRLSAKQISDLTNSLKNNADFIKSPIEREIAEYKSTQKVLEYYGKRIAKTQARLKALKALNEKEIISGNVEIKMDTTMLQKQMIEDGWDPITVRNMFTDIYPKGQPNIIPAGKLKEAFERILAEDIKNYIRFREYVAKGKYLSGEGGKAEKLWGIKVAGGEEPPIIEKEPLPKDGEGGRVITKEKTGVKPKKEIKTKTAEELEKELLPAKEKPKTEEVAETKTETKTKTKEYIPTSTEPFIIPGVKGLSYVALVWENGYIYAKVIKPQELIKGWAEYSPSNKSAARQRFQELSRTMSEEEAARIVAQEYPFADNYPIVYSRVEAQPQPKMETLQERLREPNIEKQPMPIEEYPQPEKQDRPLPAPEDITEPRKGDAGKQKQDEKIKEDEITEKTLGGMMKPEDDAPDKVKQRFLDSQVGISGYRKGALNGESIWHIWYYPYDRDDRLIVHGAPPKGFVTFTGEGSVKKTARLSRGVPPVHEIREDTGAVDEVIMPTQDERGIIVKSVKDKDNNGEIYRRGDLSIRAVQSVDKKAQKARDRDFRQARIQRQIDLGADIVKEGRRGPRHIKII